MKGNEIMENKNVGKINVVVKDEGDGYNVTCSIDGNGKLLVRGIANIIHNMVVQQCGEGADAMEHIECTESLMNLIKSDVGEIFLDDALKDFKKHTKNDDLSLSEIFEKMAEIVKEIEDKEDD